MVLPLVFLLLLVADRFSISSVAGIFETIFVFHFPLSSRPFLSHHLFLFTLAHDLLPYQKPRSPRFCDCHGFPQCRCHHSLLHCLFPPPHHLPMDGWRIGVGNLLFPLHQQEEDPQNSSSTRNTCETGRDRPQGQGCGRGRGLMVRIFGNKMLTFAHFPFDFWATGGYLSPCVVVLLFGWLLLV